MFNIKYISTTQANMDKYPHSILVKEGSVIAKISSYSLFQKLNKTVQAFFPAGMTKAKITGAQEIITGAHEIITSGDTSQASHRAFELVLNALHNAGIKLIQSELHQLKDIDKQHTLKFEIKQEINSFQLHITSDFFDYPEELPLLKPIAIWFKEWFECLGFTEEIADELKRKLPDHFFKELIKEWGKRREYYQSIETELQSPFAKAWERKYNTLQYQNELRELIHEPAMGDKKLPLSTIYIKPYFCLHKDCWNEPNKTHYESAFRNDGFLSEIDFKENIHNYIEQKIIHKETPLDIPAENHNLIFILGQPGQGKSSFCLYTINQLLEHKDFEQNIYFIRLKELPHTDDLIQHPFNVIEAYLKRRHELEFIKKDTVLILDGLDELFMVNGLTNADLEKFYKNLEEETKGEPNLTIILTSRHNYLNLSAINKKKTTILKLNGLNLQQQKNWLSIYKKANIDCKLSQEKLEEIDNNESLIHIKELIRQPILLHIVANANTDLNSQDTRSTIYKNLFDALLKRNWADEQLERYHSLEKEEYAIEFREWLQEIAFTIYSSNFEYIKRKDLEELDSTKSIQGIINTSSDLKEALKDLLVAFYFRNVQKDEKDESENKKYALEFLHKSLQEYLAAEYIWRTIKAKLLAPKDKKWKFDINDFKQSLSLFFHLFSNKSLNHSIRTLLIEMIEQDSNIEEKKILRERLKQFLPGSFKYQFLDTMGISNHKDLDTPPLNKAFNTFRGYWLILSHLNLQQNEDLLNRITQELLCYFISKAEGVNINLSNTNLNYADLKCANLNYADLSNANLRDANLSNSNLSNVNLSDADLSDANLSYANLSDVNLSDADLSNGYLAHAYLVNSYFVNSDLSDAYLVYTNLSNAILNYADLRGAILNYADLSDANLNYADLRGAILNYANLSDADLRDANLRNANLSNTYLSDAKISNTDFIEQLEKWGCIGIEEIKNKYYVDPQIHYYDLDEKKEYPYYLIKEK